MLEAALDYISRGWRVLPIWEVREDGTCACGKRHLKDRDIGKHPRTDNGFKDATIDEAQVRTWFEKWPNANIAIATGRGLLVVDVDLPDSHDGKDGPAALRALKEKYGPLPMSRLIESGSGGAHWYFSYPSERVVTSGSARLGVGIDHRADGGYILAPPSNHRLGGRYAVLVDRDVAPAPEWLLAELEKLAPQAPREQEDAPAADRVPTDATADELFNAQRLFDRQLAKLRALPDDGGRAHLAIAYTAGGIWPIPFEERLEKMLAVTQAWEHPWDPHDAERQLRGQLEAGGARPFSLDALPLTDSGNADRLARRHRDDIRYVTTWKKWLAWDGARWRQEGADATVNLLALETVRRITEESFIQSSAEKDDPYKSWATKSESRSGLDAMTALARHRRVFAIGHTALDADPWLLGTADGALDLRSGRVREAAPADLLTRLTPVALGRGDITARSWASAAPTWARFLRDVTCGDTEMESYLQRAVGYTLTGSTREQCLFFLHGVGNEGNGSNGKSTFIETVMAAMGEYAIVGAQSLLLTKRNETHPTELAAVHGARLVAVQEMQANRTWDEVTIKTLTGDRVITARRMYEDFWNFTPTHKFWISGNGKPTVRGTDDGIWRRFRMIPFEAVFRDGARDVMLPEKLLGELPGVLAWAIAGCTAWQERGLDEPAKIKAATERYRQEQDTIGQFLEDVCILEADGRVKRSDMRRAYEWWCEQEGCHPVGAKALNEQLRSRGMTEIAGVKKNAPRWIFDGSNRQQTQYSEQGWVGVTVRTAPFAVPAELRPN